MILKIPDFSLVVLVGPSGAGKSSFAARHFLPTETVSSDFCRAVIADDESNLEATNDAFEVLRFIAGKRLAAKRLTVIDATNVQPEARRPLVQLARDYHCLPVAIVFDLPRKVCLERNLNRPNRDFGEYVVAKQLSSLRRSLRGLGREGFRQVYVFKSTEQVDQAVIHREPLWNDKRTETGPFDIIGDIHGCFDELAALLDKLGYTIKEGATETGENSFTVTPPEGRKAVFLGDLVDRGPRIPDVLRLVMGMVRAGTAWCVPGNHDIKLLRALGGRNVQIKHGLAESIEQLNAEPEAFRAQVADFIDRLVSHYVLDGGKLVVAHAGMREEMQGRGSGRVRDFALYGETTGETDEFGLPVRYNWASEYRGSALVVYGHTPVPEAEWLNRTINIDTGCVFGGKLTALRYPEKELVSVEAARTYADPVRPLAAPAEATVLSAQQRHDDLLFIEDVLGKRIIETELSRTVTIREENAAAALEIISRFGINPKWLIYLPPTMSPSETSQRPDYLEYPEEAFAYFAREGAKTVVCQEKHMGSRAVVVVCRDEAAARKRFGVEGEGIGTCFTRTGRRFFNDASVQAEFLDAVRQACNRARFWDEFQTDWVCLDCELMPWSAKAMELIRRQYGAVGAAARAAFPETLDALETAHARGVEEAGPLLEKYRERAALADRFSAAYRRYCWTVDSVADLRLAPFHLLATEGTVHSVRDHEWHMQTLARLANGAESPLLMATPHRRVNLSDPTDAAEATIWWETLTEAGGEGMVVKPLEFVARGPRGIVQPALKCRGREYLRIIYGPEYTLAGNLERLRARGLGRKRSLALREFVLGLEALRRFVRREPLRRVHECTFGILALESEPVDPRL